MRKALVLGLVAVLLGQLVQGKSYEWLLEGDAPKNAETSIKLAMKYDEAGSERVKNILFDISNPHSKNYGKWKTREELRELMGPSESDCEEVKAYLRENGALSVDDKGQCAYVNAVMKVKDVERVFRTHLSTFRKGNQILYLSSAKEYIPLELRPYVSVTSGIFRRVELMHPWLNDIVRPAHNDNAGVQGPEILGLIWAGLQELVIQEVVPICSDGSKGPSEKNGTLCSGHGSPIISILANLVDLDTEQSLELNTSYLCSNTSCNLGVKNSQLEQYKTYNLSLVTVFENGQQSSKSYYNFPVLMTPYLTPSFVKSMYNIPLNMGFVAHANNSMGVAEEAYVMKFRQEDLRSFQLASGLPLIPAIIAGPGATTTDSGEGEGELDIQWVTSMAPGVPHYFWMAKTTEDFVLTWVESLLDANNPPLVSSLSWMSDNNYNVSDSYHKRIDEDFMQLGAMGQTIIVASGDAGVTNYNHGGANCDVFRPGYPTQSPYVVSVSASVFTKRTTYACESQIFGLLNPTCEGVGEVPVHPAAGVSWSSGGGFSDYANRASTAPWQVNFVNQYLNNTSVKFPPSKFFNSSNRAYPDVSVVGQNQIVVVNGQFQITGGTSASAPIFCGILSLINNERLKLNKPQLGFVNPLLYAAAAEMPYSFNDLTVGDNRCGTLACCPYGFEAASGYDTVSGLGSPNFPGLLEYALSVVNKQ